MQRDGLLSGRGTAHGAESVELLIDHKFKLGAGNTSLAHVHAAYLTALDISCGSRACRKRQKKAAEHGSCRKCHTRHVTTGSPRRTTCNTSLAESSVHALNSPAQHHCISCGSRTCRQRRAKTVMRTEHLGVHIRGLQWGVSDLVTRTSRQTEICQEGTFSRGSGAGGYCRSSAIILS